MCEFNTQLQIKKHLLIYKVGLVPMWKEFYPIDNSRVGSQAAVDLEKYGLCRQPCNEDQAPPAKHTSVESS